MKNWRYAIQNFFWRKNGLSHPLSWLSAHQVKVCNDGHFIPSYTKHAVYGVRTTPEPLFMLANHKLAHMMMSLHYPNKTQCNAKVSTNAVTLRGWKVETPSWRCFWRRNTSSKSQSGRQWIKGRGTPAQYTGSPFWLVENLAWNVRWNKLFSKYYDKETLANGQWRNSRSPKKIFPKLKLSFWGSSLWYFPCSERGESGLFCAKIDRASRKASKDISEEKWSSDRLQFPRQPPWVPYTISKVLRGKCREKGG